MSSGAPFRAAKLEVGRFLQSGCNCCRSATSATPIHGRLPAACSSAMHIRVSTTTKPKARLHSNGPSTPPCSEPRSFGMVGALLAQHGTSYGVPKLPLQCAWGGTATPPPALPSIRSSQCNFLINFDPGQRSAQRACRPLVVEELVEDGQGLGATLRTRGRFPHNFTPSRAVGVAALPCPGKQGTCRDQQRSPSRITDASRSGFFGETMIDPLIHALAGCGRRCTVLILGGIAPSSTQHRVWVASFRSEQQYLYGIATIFRFRAVVGSPQVFLSWSTTLCVSSKGLLSARRRLCQCEVQPQ